MCGIAGYINFTSKPLDMNSLVDKMLEKIAYRGPDQRGVETNTNVCLGMNRLSIIDTKKDEIPYKNSKDKVSIVYNGEVYNHDILRSSLRSKYDFKTTSDAETILNDYIEFGLKRVAIYNGMYAYAIHDQRSKKVYLVRDKAGEKPLYFVKNENFFAFASEMKSLLEVVSPKIKMQASYKAFEFCTGRETMFEGIYQLLPGEFMEIDLKVNTSKIVDYWAPWNQNINISDNLEQVKRDLTELLEDSILLRTKNCAHQFAVFTGGGVDSALMACIAKPDKLYYCHYDLGSAFDELEYAKLVSKKSGSELCIVEPTKEDYSRVHENISYHLDTPCTWTSFSLWMLLESLPSEIKVIMTGEGADECFAGYHRYHLLHHDEQIHKLDAMQEYGYLIGKYYGSPVERYLRLVNRSENIYDEEVNTYLKNLIQYYFDAVDNNVVHGMGLFDLFTTMQVLLQMSDRMSMAFSKENRSPFLDYRLLEFAFNLDSGFKINEGRTKWILKEVSKQFIPLEIANRVDKRGFSAPLNIWFGWDQAGKYDRTGYKREAFEAWKKNYF